MKANAPADIFVSVLRDRRAKLGITSDDLAKRLGLHPYIIPEWESGKRYPRLAIAIKWAQALGIALELRGEG